MAIEQLVLLPGLLCDDAVWTEQRAALAPQAESFVADFNDLDSIKGMAEKVLDTAPYKVFSLAGHSMGGRVAMEVVRLAPQRVRRLALLDTGFEPRVAGQAAQAERDKRMALRAVAQKQGMRAMGKLWAPGMVHPDHLATPLFDAILDMIERRTPKQFEAQITALLARPDATPVLQSLACPTVFICGRQDLWSPLSRHEAMLKLAPPQVGELHAIEDCGHMSTMEKPQAVSGILAKWLAA